MNDDHEDDSTYYLTLLDRQKRLPLTQDCIPDYSQSYNVLNIIVII
jgi:hypothetical protein